MDKNFQLAILKKLADVYPLSAISIYNQLLDMSVGETEKEKIIYLYRHLFALNEAGYIKDVGRVTSDDALQINHAFKITLQGLNAAGEAVLMPASFSEEGKLLLATLEGMKNLNESNRRTLKELLYTLPLEALKHLQEKGLDKLVALLFD